MQEVYINLDDSGKLTTNENYLVYGGIVFLSKESKDKFINQYRSIINDIKCKYCFKNKICDNICPEIKNTNIKQSDKRRVLNYIKKYYTICLIVDNKKIYKSIKDSKASRGRFIDYAIRRLIKNTINSLIKSKLINPKKQIKLIINIDQQSTKSNGYYSLKDGLEEELKYGIINYNYAKIVKPIIKGDLIISIKYQNSKKCYVVQASDLIAGTIRQYLINDIKDKKLINYKLLLP